MNKVLNMKQNNQFYRTTGHIILSVFIIYLTMGMALGTLPMFILNKLNFSSFIVGIVIGLQSLSTLLTRAYSGKLSDTKGPKASKSIGVILVAAAAVIYTLAIASTQFPILALVLLLFARLLHGVSESLLVTGALAWGIGLVGHEKSGKVMTWNGIAMYAGIAFGAPLSIWIAKYTDIKYTFIIMIILSLLSWLSTFKLPTIHIDKNHVRTPFHKVIGDIAKQGVSLGLSSIAFGCISSFIALLFMEKNWGDASLAFTTFGICYILPRLIFSSFPDKYGGFIITLVSLLIEIFGQIVIGFASTKIMAVIGCGLTGIGFSLIYPSLGVLIIKKVSPQMRTTALGAYSAFFDLSLALTVPLAGLIAGNFNYQAVYFFGAVNCLLAFLLILYRRT